MHRAPQIGQSREYRGRSRRLRSCIAYFNPSQHQTGLIESLGSCFQLCLCHTKYLSRTNSCTYICIFIFYGHRTCTDTIYVHIWAKYNKHLNKYVKKRQFFSGWDVINSQLISDQVQVFLLDLVDSFIHITHWPQISLRSLCQHILRQRKIDQV